MGYQHEFVCTNCEHSETHYVYDCEYNGFGISHCPECGGTME